MGFIKNNKLLRKFQYKEALKSALKSNNSFNISALLYELIKRNSTNKAIIKNNINLKLLLRWIIKFIDDYRFKTIIYQVMEEIIKIKIDNYGLCTKINYEWTVLMNKLKEEFKYLKNIMRLQGMLGLI